MAKGLYLEHYLDSIDGLPFELHRNFSLMGDLDNRTEGKKAEINELAAEYVAKVRNLGSDARVEHLKRIENAFNKCKEYSDDKVQLAMQIYEMVDKHIRRLDAELARFENDLQEKPDADIQESSDETQSQDKNVKEKRRPHVRDKKGSDQDSPKRKKQKNGPNISEALLTMHPSDVLDMPVDPNEPTYCLCSQVSYGEMIGCDNVDCSIEWFHFACVGLTVKPKGKWYCPRCIQDTRKKSSVSL